MAVNLPVQNFFSRTVEPSAWVRPSDWPVITDAPNEVQFLFADINNASCTIRTNFTRNSGSQNVTIDWGDGTSNVVTTNATTNTTHVYTPGTGTPCSRGYTTFKIRVYFTGVGSTVLTACRLFGVLVGANTNNIYNNVGLLEAYYGNGTQTLNMSGYYQSNTNAANSISSFTFLEYVKLPATVTFNLFDNTFENCASLAVVVMPTSASAITTFSFTFNNCFSLRSITLPSNSTNVTTYSNCFANCVSLTSITFPTTLNSVSNGFASCFSGCFSLKNVTFPSVNICINFASAFINCYSLEWVRFTSLPTFGSSTAVSFNNTFSSCFNLQNVYFPATCSANASYDCSSMFTNCYNLKTITFPSGFNPSSIANALQQCYSLKSVIFLSGASNLSNCNFAFASSINLTYVKLPTTASSSGVSLTSVFSGCTALKTITIPNTYLITTMDSAFSGCISLQTLDWTPGAQNSLTTLSSTFNNCILLGSINMPTSMTALTTMASCFSTCRSLRTITLPSSLNAVTTFASTFASCTILESVTLPTSATSATNFSSMFSSSITIRNVVLPFTVSASTTTFASTFNNCGSLESITFPGSQQLSSVNSIASCFANCGNLTTLINFDKIGSLTATPLCIANANSFLSIPAISFVAPLTSLALNGSSVGRAPNIQSVRLLNTSAGQWTGTSPQINISITNMSTAQIVQLFNDMAAQGNVTSKTINITNATGAAGLTAANRLIVTSKGWTITG